MPGFVEIDLVGHEGGVASGQFCFTLTVTDVATGWTVNRSVPNKAQKWVFAALQYALGRFPFPILGIDWDNGSEFINDYLFEYCHAPTDHLHQVPGGEQKRQGSRRAKALGPGPGTRGLLRYDTTAELEKRNEIW